MDDDLVKRLRRDVQWIPGKHYAKQLEEIMDEAADAIERLSAENAALKQERDNAIYLAHQREQMFEQRKELVRDMQGVAQKTEVQNENLRSRIAELESGQRVEVRGEMWQLVQVNPSEKMIIAGDKFMESTSDLGNAWCAMLTASAQEAQEDKT